MCDICNQSPCLGGCPNHAEKVIGACCSCGKELYQSDTYFEVVNDYEISSLCEECHNEYLINSATQDDYDEFCIDEKVCDIANWIKCIVDDMTDIDIIEKLSFLFTPDERKKYCEEYDSAFIEWRMNSYGKLR